MIDFFIIGIQSAFDDAAREAKLRDAARRSMGRLAYDEWLEARVRQEEADERADEHERRHQETLDSIRSTSFWRFGR